MTEERRNDFRKWSDRVHRILGVITAAAVLWIFTQAHETSKDNAVLNETLENINKSISSLNTRVTVLETIRIEIAKSHYTKPEVESLVDRSIRPLQRDIVRLENNLTSRLDKIYDELKK